MATAEHGLRLLSIYLLLLLLAGCGTGKSDMLASPAAPAAAEAGLPPGERPFGPATILHDVLMQPQAELASAPRGVSFAAPVDLHSLLPALDPTRDASCIGTGWYLEGSDYSDELDNLNVVRTGLEATDGEFSPSFSGNLHSDGSFAIYRWNLRNYTGEQTIGFNWLADAQPAEWGDFYVGLGNLSLNRWQFYEGPADGVLTIDSFGPYRAADGEMLMAIILLGQQSATLDFMEAGVAEQRATGAEDLPDGEPDFPLLGQTGNLPAQFDLSDFCAPINDQGLWGSCTAFAVGDGAYNYELQQTYGSIGWDLEQARFRVSPKHLYIVSGELQNFPPGGGSGRWTDQVIAGLLDHGVATELNAPYDLIYDNNWSDAALADAQVLEIDGWQEIPCNSWEGVETVKQVLASQLKVLPMQAWLDNGFFSLGPGDVWYTTGFVAGGHAMCIVGYDDARGSSGAFKVRNSWGEYWGDGGYVWIAYETFINPYAGIRCWTMDEEYNPQLAQYFKLDDSGQLPVTGLQASKGTNPAGIKLDWKQQSGVTSYTIYRDDKSLVAATVQAPDNSWLDTSIADSFGHIYWVQAATGPLSSPDVGYLAATPQIVAINPKSGTEQEQISISAAILGSPPLSYSWDFGAAATPSTSTAARPALTLNGPGSYSASLVLSNPLGSDTFNFVIEVGPLPSIISSVSGASGFSGDVTSLSAQFSGTPQSYLWDFGGGAVPGSSSEAQPTVTLGAAGIYDASLQVSNGEINDTFHFNLAVLDGSAQAWSMTGFDLRNSHQSPVNGPASSNLKWKFLAQKPYIDRTLMRVSGVVELPGGDIIVGSSNFENGSALYRLTPAGAIVWEKLYPQQGGLGQPVLSTGGERVYSVFNGTISCLDSADGQEQWSASPEGGYGYQVLLEAPNGQLYVLISGKWLASLDAETGSKVLDPVILSDKYNKVRTGQLAPNGMLFLPGRMGYDNLLLSFDTLTNTPAGTNRFPWAIQNMAIAPDGITVIVTDDQGEIRALDTNTCQELWKQRDIPGGGSVPCIMANGTIIVSNDKGLVNALDPGNGEVLWTYDLQIDQDSRSYPALGRDGTVYLGGADSRVYAISDGSLLWQSDTSATRYFNGSAAIASDGTCYIGDEAGMLWAFGPGSGETLSRPVIDQVAPRNGDSGEQISTTAYLDFGSAPFTYSWDFGGGATPNTSTEASPLITLGAIGSYSASVVVSNAWGTDSLDFTLVVKDPNAPPEWVSHKIDLFGALTGGFASAGSVNGKPAFFAVKLNSPDPILYYYESSVAEPALDIDWSRETVLDRAYTDKHVSMQVFDGEPAVAYVYDAQTLRYTVRNGGTWEHQDILTGNYFGKNLSMATVNGLPAIAFGNYDSAQWRLGYARSDSLSPASPADWQTSYFTSCNIDGGSLSLADNAGKPDVAFITRDVSDVFHVTYVHGLSSAPTGNADWLLHYVYSGINYRDKFVFSQYAGKPQLAFTLHGTDDDLLYAGATLAAPGSSADWNIHTLHSGGQILPVRVYAGSDNNWPVLCWTDDSASPVGYSNANVPQPLQAADWDTAQYPLGIIVLAAMEVNGNPVLIGLTEPERELRYYCYK